MDKEDSTSSMSVQDLVHLAETTWRKAQVLRLSPPLREGPAAPYLSNCLVERGKEAEEALIQLLAHESALVCAYALWSLFEMKSSVFDRLPDELTKRKDSVTVVTGSFSNRNDLGGWARHLRKQFRLRGRGDGAV